MFHVTDLKTIIRLFRIYIMAQMSLPKYANLTVFVSLDMSVHSP